MKYKYTFFEKSTENYWENHYSLISLQLKPLPLPLPQPQPQPKL